MHWNDHVEFDERRSRGQPPNTRTRDAVKLARRVLEMCDLKLTTERKGQWHRLSQMFADEDGPEIQFIPGTTIPRLRLTHLGEKVRVGFEDEIEALAEALRAARDAKLTDCNGGAKAAGNESQREGAA